MIITMANLCKLKFGIANLAAAKYISDAGIYGALIGFTYVLSINLYCIYLLLKARNRFKNYRIKDICDLSVILYGEWARKWTAAIIVCSSSLLLIAYVKYFGTELDKLFCTTLKVAQCGQNLKYAIFA